MTELTAAYFEAYANAIGTSESCLPGRSSEERAAYFDEFGANRDYTWALQTFQAIKADVQAYEDYEVEERFEDYILEAQPYLPTQTYTFVIDEVSYSISI